MNRLVRRGAGLLAALALATGAARAAPLPPGIDLPLDSDADLTTAALTSTPDNDDLQRFYPQLPLMLDLAGKATMACHVRVDGQLDDCHILSEAPAGLGFGVATLKTAQFFRVRPAMRDGKPVDGHITIPLRWQSGEISGPPKPEVLPAVQPEALALSRQLVLLSDYSEGVRKVWKPWLDQKTTELMTAGDAQTARRMGDAFRLGLDDAIAAEADRKAYTLAAHVSVADLRAAVAYLQSPAAKALKAASTDVHEEQSRDLMMRVSAATKARFCADSACAVDPAAVR